MKRLFSIMFCLLIILPLGAQEDWDGDFSDGFSDFTEETSLWSVTGRGILSYRSPLPDWEKAQETSLEPDVVIFSEIKHDSRDTQLIVSTKFSRETIENQPRDTLQEAYIRYFGPITINLGLTKITWGKGDSLRVLDEINGQDFSDFLNQDEIDRKIAAHLVKLDFPLGYWGQLETLLVPEKTPHRVALEGDWVQEDGEALLLGMRYLLYYGPGGTGGLYDSQYAIILGGLYASVYADAITAGNDDATATAIANAAIPTLQLQAAELAKESANAMIDEKLEELMNTETEIKAEDAQAGIRLSGTFSGFDFALQYFYGFSKIPIFPDLSSFTTLEDLENISLEYPRIHLIGGDMAFILWEFNIRGEGVFSLAQDRDLSGLDTFRMTLGVDRKIPYTDLSLNLQYLGNYPFSEEYTHTLAGDLSDSFFQENLELHLTGALNLPDRDYMFYPHGSYAITGNFHIEAGYKGFYGEETSLFGQFAQQSYGEIKVKYIF